MDNGLCCEFRDGAGRRALPGSVSRTLGLHRTTVQRFARQSDVTKLLVKATSRETKLDPFKARINQRRNDGITSAAALHAEPQANGWPGSARAVERYVRPFRPMTAAPPPRPKAPSPKSRCSNATCTAAPASACSASASSSTPADHHHGIRSRAG
jgi:septal ring-binding cell division protein DamX